MSTEGSRSAFANVPRPVMACLFALLFVVHMFGPNYKGWILFANAQTTEQSEIVQDMLLRHVRDSLACAHQDVKTAFGEPKPPAGFDPDADPAIIDMLLASANRLARTVADGSQQNDLQALHSLRLELSKLRVRF